MSENSTNGAAGPDSGPDADPDPEAAELDLEAPEADVAEQRAEVLGDPGEPLTPGPSDQVQEADPADAADQRRIVEQDEDDYR
jgi:hypothetical protein